MKSKKSIKIPLKTSSKLNKSSSSIEENNDEFIEKLLELLDEIKNQSQIILKNMLPIMQELLKEDDNEILEEVIYRTKIKKDKALTNLQNKTTIITENAQKVFEEIDKFKKIIESNINKNLNRAIEKHMDKYPFLAEVWFGDMYNTQEGINGLVTLLKELNATLLISNEDYIIKAARKELTSMPINKK